MQKTTIMDRIEIEPQTGHVGVRFRKEVVDDNGKVLASEYHRVMIDPDADPEALMTAGNDHLGAMGYPAAKDGDMAVLSTVVTPLASHRAAKAQEARDKGKK